MVNVAVTYVFKLSMQTDDLNKNAYPDPTPKNAASYQATLRVRLCATEVQLWKDIELYIEKLRNLIQYESTEAMLSVHLER